MDSDRLKAMTDGVIAVIITIMVLEMKTPDGATPEALLKVAPTFISYILSFVYVAIYWNNHHHFYMLTPKIDGGIMWANFNFLFWLSLIPFVTKWAGENVLQPWPAAVYGAVLLACAVSWYLMQTVIIRAQGPDSPLKRALGNDWKGKISPVLYIAGIVVAFLQPGIAALIYAGTACLWLIPDLRVHEALQDSGE